MPLFRSDDDGTVPLPPPAAARTRPAPAAPPRKRRFRAVRTLFVLGLVVLAFWSCTIAAISLWGRRDEARRADAIVVLGAAQYDGRPSPVLQARLDHAIALYREGMAPIVILTGGVGPGDTVSEAVAGARYARRQGVPESALVTERTGLTTAASLAAVADTLRNRGLEEAVLVSDPFHMLRLKLLARRFGFTGLTSPTRSSPISRNRAEERRHLLRESFGLPLALIERP